MSYLHTEIWHLILTKCNDGDIIEMYYVNHVLKRIIDKFLEMTTFVGFKSNFIRTNPSRYGLYCYTNERCLRMIYEDANSDHLLSFYTEDPWIALEYGRLEFYLSSLTDKQLKRAFSASLISSNLDLWQTINHEIEQRQLDINYQIILEDMIIYGGLKQVKFISLRVNKKVDIVVEYIDYKKYKYLTLVGFRVVASIIKKSSKKWIDNNLSNFSKVYHRIFQREKDIYYVIKHKIKNKYFFDLMLCYADNQSFKDYLDFLGDIKIIKYIEDVLLGTHKKIKDGNLYTLVRKMELLDILHKYKKIISNICQQFGEIEVWKIIKFVHHISFSCDKDFFKFISNIYTEKQLADKLVLWSTKVDTPLGDIICQTYSHLLNT